MQICHIICLLDIGVHLGYGFEMFKTWFYFQNFANLRFQINGFYF